MTEEQKRREYEKWAALEGRLRFSNKMHEESFKAWLHGYAAGLDVGLAESEEKIEKAKDSAMAEGRAAGYQEAKHPPVDY